MSGPAGPMAPLRRLLMRATTPSEYPSPSETSSAPPTVLLEIAADGGTAVGFGHVGRCVALWEELGDESVFRISDPLAAEFLRARGATVAPGPVEAPIVLLDRIAPTGEAEVRALQAGGRRVVLLDDLGSGRSAADLVIDPPTAAEWPTAHVRLAGFEHVLLRREVRNATRERGTVTLLSMGGSDPTGLTPPLAAALARSGIEPTVALGPGYRGVRPAAGHLLPGPEAFVEALASSAVLVAGFGHSLLEAAHLGVPAIAVVARPEHRKHAEAFCQAGTAVLVDMSNGPEPDELVAQVRALHGDPERREAMASRGRALVDGRGAERIAHAIRRLA